MAKAKYTKGSDGFFRTKIWDGSYNLDGSKHRVCLSSKKSSADLEKKVNALKEKVKNGDTVQMTDLTFVQYAKQWRRTYKEIREGNTKHMYDNIIDKHFLILSAVRIQDIRKIHLQLLINNASDKPRTCQQIALTFRQIIKSAIQDRLLPAGAYNDICENIDLPKYIPTEKRALYPEEIKAIRRADFTDRERCFVYIIYGCGLRRGEVLALTKDLSIDLKTGFMKVNKSVYFNNNDPEIKDPKTANGFREVPMPKFLIDFLSGYIPTLSSPYLISKMDGSLMTKSAYDKMWSQILKKINRAAGGTDQLQIVYDLTAHTFRHNYCSSLCYQVPTISIKRIAKLMGDTEAVVLNVYNHIQEHRENVEKAVNDAIAL